jgi:hypothetical protein
MHAVRLLKNYGHCFTKASVTDLFLESVLITSTALWCFDISVIGRIHVSYLVHTMEIICSNFDGTVYFD